MISRHDIRQTAVQFLYGVGIQPDGEKAEGLCDFSSWDIVLEPARTTLARARAKAVEHVTRNRADRLRVIQTRIDSAVAAMKEDLATSDLRDALADILAREESMDDALKSVKIAAKTADLSDFNALESSFAPLFLVNETLVLARARVLARVKDHPQYASVLTPLSSALNRMQEIGELLRGIEHPEQSASQSEIMKVVEGSADMQEIRKETEKLVSAVLAQLNELDGAIAQVTDNFSPARVSPVDRAILRIGAYELKNCQELPVAVIIKEAIILTEEYSVNEASKFINGVLAGVSGIYRPQN